jgi:hypothetical protein
MKKVALLGLAGVLTAIMASCNNAPAVDSGENSTVKYVMGTTELTAAQVVQLEQDHGALHLDVDSSVAGETILRVFLERAERDLYANSVKPAFCISTRTKSTFWDGTSYSGSSFDLGKGSSIADLSTKFMFGGKSWDNAIDSIKPADCTVTVLFTDAGFNGTSLSLGGNDNTSSLGVAFDNKISSVSVLP